MDPRNQPSLLERIYSWENLLDAYHEAASEKWYRNDVTAFAANLEENLISIQNDLIWHTYKVGRYRQFYVHEPKKRLVMALGFRARVVQWAIYLQTNQYLDNGKKDHSDGCRVGKGTTRAADRLQYWCTLVDRKPGKWYYLKLDISKFFYRVNHAKLLKILAKRIKDPELMKFLGSVVNSRAEPFGLPRGKAPQDTPPEEWLYDVGMPIGNLTSQLFANIYMNELDQYCKHVLKIHYYIRYMDDIVILGENKETLHEWKAEIETCPHEELELDLNNKTCIRPVRMGVEFVGVRIWPTYMKLRKSTVGRLKREVKKISELYASGQMDEEAFKRRVASIKGLLEHTESESLRWRLNQIYLDAVRKYGKTDPEETLWKGKNDGKKVA